MSYTDAIAFGMQDDEFLHEALSSLSGSGSIARVGRGRRLQAWPAAILETNNDITDAWLQG
jgi:hypothetical protein